MLPYDFASIASLLLTRLASQARAIAVLMDNGIDLETRTIVRSLLEHLVLLAWLAIDGVQGGQGTVLADLRSSEERTRWWVADQFRRQQRLLDEQVPAFPPFLDAATRAGLRDAKKLLKTERAWGELPRIQDMARAADACWGGNVTGWPAAIAGQPAFGLTLYGFHLTLFQAGNASTHPNLDAAFGAFTTPKNADDANVMLTPARAGRPLSVATALTPYVLLYAFGIAERRLAWTSMDDALRVLGRFEVVRGPGLSLTAAWEVLGATDARRFGLDADTWISVQRRGDETTYVAIEQTGWVRLRHRPGPLWTWDGEHIESTHAGRMELDEEFARRIAGARMRVKQARWLSAGHRSHAWPPAAP